MALYPPRRDRWAEHVQLTDTDVIEPLTACGRVTACWLRMNRLDLVADRARLIALEHYPNAGQA